MIQGINWDTIHTCDVCHETYVQTSPPKVDMEQFYEGDPCIGCGHKSLKFE